MLLYPLVLCAQTTIRGQVLDSITQKPIADAHVYANNAGTTTAADGSFELSLPSNTQQVTITHVAYKRQIVDIKQFKQTIKLSPNPIDLKEIPVLSLSGNSRAKRLLRKAIANYYRHVRGGWFTAIMEQRQHVSPPNAPADSLLIRARVVSANLRSAHDTVTTRQGEPHFCAIGIIHSPLMDTTLYTPPAHMKPKELPLPSPHYANKLLQNYFFLTHTDPGIIMTQYFEEASPYLMLPHRTPDTIVVGVVNYGYSSDYYTLTERQFRRKHRRQLQQWKESIGYSPSSPIYAATEQQVDSLFYAMLRHRMQHGSQTRREARFHICNSTQTVVKVELMAAHRDRYTELRYEYTNTLQGASPSLTLGRLQVRSNPKGYDITTDIRFFNHRFTRTPATLNVEPMEVLYF